MPKQMKTVSMMLSSSEMKKDSTTKLSRNERTARTAANAGPCRAQGQSRQSVSVC